MELVELLTVADRFQLSYDLVVTPDFAVPAKGWRPCSQTAILVTPEGRSFETTVGMAIAHFNISDRGAPEERRWRVVVSFPKLTKEEVPIGSKLMVSRTLKEALLPDQKP